jgi:energy-coupling factor transporter ATP-binding protein EcfA2
MVKLHWLQVNTFRSVKPGTRLTFNDGYNVLLGQNGTGKTTMLNLISAAVSSDFEDIKDADFDLSYQLASDEASATVSIKNERRPLPSPSPTPVFFTEIKLALHDKTFLIITVNGDWVIVQYVEDERTTLNKRFDSDHIRQFQLASWIFRAVDPRILSNKETRDAARKLLTELFTTKPTLRLDETLYYQNGIGDFTFEVFNRHDGVTFLHTLNDPHRLFFGPAQEFVQMLQANPDRARVALDSTQVPFLQEVIRVLDFESAEAVMELQETTRLEDDELLRFANLQFFFTHRAGWKTSDKHLSHGQRRVLALMHYLATTRAIAIVDELVNGLHHRWTRECLEALGSRQVFVASQNPLLLDHLAFQSAEEVRSTFILCRWEQGSEQLVWEHMTHEAAEDFFASYKVGFQGVGELLRSKGLW